LRRILPVADFQTGLSLAPGIDYSNRTENQEEHQDLEVSGEHSGQASLGKNWFNEVSNLPAQSHRNH
jgi:hypothetical protein